MPALLTKQNLNIVRTLLAYKPLGEEKLSRVKRNLARDFAIGMVANNWLLKIYRQALDKKKIKPAPWLENVLIKRRVRTLSGVAPVTVATKPYPCPGQCVYCPSEARMPKSYLPAQPAAARALRFKYHPYHQVQGRLQALYDNGHQPEKVELRVLGGTWSYYPKQYQSWFIKKLYSALNEFNPHSKFKVRGSKLQFKIQNLERLQKINERAQHRCVGLSIETRPDYVNLDEIKRLRKFGVTKIELGVQHLDQKILDLIRRNQTKDEVIAATKLLKDAGFKICYHIMSNLPGSTPQKDLKMFKKLFDNSYLRPDQLKIYPCVVLKSAPLYHWWREGRYKTYPDRVLIKLLAQMKRIVPPYVRIERIYRDVPSEDIIAGCRHTNIRELVQKRIRQEGRQCRCRCIRCREVRNRITKLPPKIFINKYKASDGVEYFISVESTDRRVLYAFLRLRLLSKDRQNQLSPLQNTALIREMHTYGPLVPIANCQLVITNYSQHRGLGKEMLAKAEQIAKTAGYAKIGIIAGVGVREYYRRWGYELEEKWGYMMKKF